MSVGIIYSNSVINRKWVIQLYYNRNRSSCQDPIYRPCKYSGYRVQPRRNELLFETVGGGPLETVSEQRDVCKTNDFENSFIIGNKIRIYFGHESLSNYAINVLVVAKRFAQHKGIS